MSGEREILNAAEMDSMLNRLAFQIIEMCPKSEKTAIVGIKRGGAFLADRLRTKVKETANKEYLGGSLDITLYRDDLSEISDYPVIHGSTVDFDVRGTHIVLVDDVLYTGRTVRAALDALNDLGRPSKISLVVLIDRGHRELPIQADFVGKNVPTSQKEIVHVQLVEKDGKDSVIIEKV